MNILIKLFLIGLCITALGIYCIQRGFINVSDVTDRLFPSGKRHLQYTVFPKQSIGPFPSKNRSSCSCDGFALTAQNVKVDELEDLKRRRLEEYEKYQIRMGTNMDSIILAQANSPLQYPTQGFVVPPLTKILIPGLALYAQRRQLYKVSLSVKRGVLSVEDVLDGQQVEGQGQIELSISSSSLTQLNDLLSRVTYTSTIYHVKTKDQVNFSFEDHEAIFPID